MKFRPIWLPWLSVIIPKVVVPSVVAPFGSTHHFLRKIIACKSLKLLKHFFLCTTLIFGIVGVGSNHEDSVIKHWDGFNFKFLRLSIGHELLTFLQL